MNKHENALYIVPTPIGNMSDITLRALEVLRSVGLVACEDPRVTMRIFNFYGIPIPKLVQYTEYTPQRVVENILQSVTSGGVALTSNAGTPVVSDPGHSLVRTAIDCGIKVIPLPGCSSVITAISASYMCNKSFIFLGFLPKSTSDKFAILKKHAATGSSIIIFENSKRLPHTLKVISEALSNPFVEIARELTKIHESFVRGHIDDLVLTLDSLRGEVVLIIDCSKYQNHQVDCKNSDESIVAALTIQRESTKNITKSLWTKDGALSKRDVYNNILRIKKSIAKSDP